MTQPKINQSPVVHTKTTKKFIIVKGWRHPKSGGDDYPFERGFIIPEGKTIEQFKNYFEKKLNKNSGAPSDFIIKEVTEDVWNKQFTM